VERGPPTVWQGSFPGAFRMKLGLVLAGPVTRPLPSTRIAILNLLPGLKAAGWESVVLHSPSEAIETPTLDLSALAIARSGVSVVVFQKVYGPDAVRLAVELRALRVSSIFMVCDRVVAEMAAATDRTVVVTDHLASLYPNSLADRVRVIHDGIERPEVQKQEWRDDRGSSTKPLSAILVTAGRVNRVPLPCPMPKWLALTIVGNYPELETVGARLKRYARSISQHPPSGARELVLDFHRHVRTVRWNQTGVYDELCNADIGIIPVHRSPSTAGDQPPPAWSVKSENRLTLKMAVGLPVVATPIPAYLPVIRDGQNGYLASDATRWITALSELRDPARRRAMGQRARADALSRYSMQRQLTLMLGVLSELTATEDTR
jgi:glycosyltransferase involved in cell wall biosynthesis